MKEKILSRKVNVINEKSLEFIDGYAIADASIIQEIFDNGKIRYETTKGKGVIKQDKTEVIKFDDEIDQIIYLGYSNFLKISEPKKIYTEGQIDYLKERMQNDLDLGVNLHYDRMPETYEETLEINEIEFNLQPKFLKAYLTLALIYNNKEKEIYSWEGNEYPFDFKDNFKDSVKTYNYRIIRDKNMYLLNIIDESLFYSISNGTTINYTPRSNSKGFNVRRRMK